MAMSVCARNRVLAVSACILSAYIDMLYGSTRTKVCVCSDIKGALSSLLRTFTADDGSNGSTGEGDKIAAVARDGADQRPLSATPSTLGASPPGRRRTKQDAVEKEFGDEPHQPNGPRSVIERPHAHVHAAQES